MVRAFREPHRKIGDFSAENPFLIPQKTGDFLTFDIAESPAKFHRNRDCGGGATAAACAHPLHTFLLRRGKEKYGDEIIKLSGELLGDDRRDGSRTDGSDDGNDVRGSEE